MPITTKTNPKANAAAQAAPPYLITGAKAQQVLAEEEAKTEARRAEAGKPFRFFLVAGGEATVTFLDGDLNEVGEIEWPLIYEHRVKVAGNWDSYMCTSMTETCPICEGGDQPKVVAVGFLLNHTPYTIQKGPNAGKVLQHRRQLYVPTRTTLAVLSKWAKKLGGLAGRTFEISRNKSDGTRAGDVFMPSGDQKWTIAQLKQKYGDEAEPMDIGEAMTYRSAAELAKLGLGPSTAATAEPAPGMEGGGQEVDDEIPF